MLVHNIISCDLGIVSCNRIFLDAVLYLIASRIILRKACKTVCPLSCNSIRCHSNIVHLVIAIHQTDCDVLWSHAILIISIIPCLCSTDVDKLFILVYKCYSSYIPIDNRHVITDGYCIAIHFTCYSVLVTLYVCI